MVEHDDAAHPVDVLIAELEPVTRRSHHEAIARAMAPALQRALAGGP